MIIKPICPFIGKECISDGFSRDTIKTGILRPCAFYDDYCGDEMEPCRIKRAVNIINKESSVKKAGDTTPEVPFNY